MVFLIYERNVQQIREHIDIKGIYFSLVITLMTRSKNQSERNNFHPTRFLESYIAFPYKHQLN